ncbi:MAG: contractile injection system protein, VgrG/Pvc8 family [Spirochaetales bacterium]|nr:contractile injection system protein, VgrG/Pvc8 family [Spirochaetales bacterium]
MSDVNVTLTPSFIVYINGTRLGVAHEASVRQIVVKDQLDSPSTCRLILSDMDRAWVDSADFELAQNVSVFLGFKDAVEEVFNGEITGSEVILKKQADATVVLNCSNKMHRLFKVNKHRIFNQVTDEDILTTIVGEYGLTADADVLSTEHVVRVQEGISDYEFLKRMADEYHYRLWVKEDILYLKEDPTSTADIVLEWGKTLLDFNASRETEKLVTEVEVVGWDNMSGDGFSAVAADSLVTLKVGTGNLGQKVASDNFGVRRLVVKDEDVPDQQTAETKATNILSGNSWAFMKAQAVCEGDNRIMAGCSVDIKETGERFSGLYRVKKVLHNYHASSGYRTNCELERNCDT